MFTFLSDHSLQLDLTKQVFPMNLHACPTVPQPRYSGRSLRDIKISLEQSEYYIMYNLTKMFFFTNDSKIVFFCWWCRGALIKKSVLSLNLGWGGPIFVRDHLTRRKMIQFWKGRIIKNLCKFSFWKSEIVIHSWSLVNYSKLDNLVLYPLLLSL